MLIDYFNGCTRARGLSIAAQIKIMGEPSLVFIGLWFGFIQLSSEKYKIMSWKKKEFEDLEDLVVSLRLYFVITRDSLCISTIYYLLLLAQCPHVVAGKSKNCWLQKYKSTHGQWKKLLSRCPLARASSLLSCRRCFLVVLLSPPLPLFLTCVGPHARLSYYLAPPPAAVSSPKIAPHVV
jgi:hypothetical protein